MNHEFRNEGMAHAAGGMGRQIGPAHGAPQ
jgi:hypothetical protein